MTTGLQIFTATLNIILCMVKYVEASCQKCPVPTSDIGIEIHFNNYTLTLPDMGSHHQTSKTILY